MSIGSEKSDVTPHRRDFFTNSVGETNWSKCM